MGQYRLVISFAWSFGLWAKYEPNEGIRSVSILFPFVGVYIGLTDYANGVEIFGKEF